MRREIWRRIKAKVPLFRAEERLGIFIIILVVIIRLTGNFQFLEWTTLDSFLRLRPWETVDERIVIVGINEDDIDSIGKYPIPDREIAALIRKLQEYQPKAIGLDIVRDKPVEPGYTELAKVFTESKNIIGIEKIQPPNKFSPPPALPTQQVGFSDVIPDGDGKYRRILLGNSSDEGYKFSFSLRLAETYLARKGISLENGIKDRHAMRFGSAEIPRLTPNSGGYVGTDAGGVKVLLNFRSSRGFRTLSLQDIKTGKFNRKWISDRIVIIGITTPTVPDFIDTSAIAGLRLSGEIYGVEFQSHAVSQIISAVLDKRPLLKSWSDEWEYLWILGWGAIAISLGWWIQSPWKNLFAFGTLSISIIGLGYILLLWGWWIPVAPILLLLAINVVGLSAFYQYDRSLKSQISTRQRAINLAFTEIHNGPLQTLAVLLREVQSQDTPKEKLYTRLQALNQEIRDIGEYLPGETIDKNESLRLVSGLVIDLRLPIHNLFYEVYSSTIERDLPYFETLRAKIRSFDPIEEQLSLEQKRELCRFLEEALCNVGKHAKGVTRLYATGTKKEDWYSLKIKDNGPGICSYCESKGTKQSKELAKQLGGYFNRESLSPKGTLCELTWCLTNRSWQFRKMKAKLKIHLLNILKKIFIKRF